MVSYNGKNVVITGASGGMGVVLCKQLAEQGAMLSLCSNDKERLDNLVKELDGKTSVFAKVVDITNEAEVEKFFEEAYAANGEFAALCNLAGLSIPTKIPEAEVSAYDLMMDVNVKGTFLASKHFAAHVADEAIVVNIGSMAARNANGNAPLYCTAKAAVNMFSQGLRIQLGPKNVRVTTVNPGGADTPFWGTREVDKSKLMQAEEVVEVIMFVLMSNPKIQIYDIFFESSKRF